MRRSTRAVYVLTRNKIRDILLSINPSYYIQVMAYILHSNERVGELLIIASSPAERAEEYRRAIEDCTLPNSPSLAPDKAPSVKEKVKKEKPRIIANISGWKPFGE